MSKCDCDACAKRMDERAEEDAYRLMREDRDRLFSALRDLLETHTPGNASRARAALEKVTT